MDQTKQHPTAENLHLLSIKLTNGAIKGTNVAETEITQFAVSFDTETFTWLDEEQIKISFTVKMTALSEDKKALDVEGQYTLEFIFKIDGLAKFSTTSADAVNLDRGLGAMMMGVVYSTTRGIVWSRTQGTVLESVIIPVVDPITLLPASNLEEIIDKEEAETL